ncbi:inositol monophosphatase, partial [Candidatus Micrarchaeota archaeon CG06_land_8_20_14_3_00_50_6]
LELDLKIVDFPAGALIVEEAGGKVTDTKGKPWSLETKDFLATNGILHDKLLKIINAK